MRTWAYLIVVLGVCAPGCESEPAPPEATEDDDAYLDRDVVTSIPAGDAVGDMFSGDYQIRSTTVSCAGACGPIDVGDTTYVVCERDQETIEWVTVYQEDGELRVDLDDDGHIGINVDGFAPVRLTGGIDADGRWDVGGYDTKFGDDLESAARARGTFEQGEEPEGTLEVHTHGVVSQTEVDCRITHRLVSAEPPE